MCLYQSCVMLCVCVCIHAFTVCELASIAHHGCCVVDCDTFKWFCILYRHIKPWSPSLIMQHGIEVCSCSMHTQSQSSFILSYNLCRVKGRSTQWTWWPFWKTSKSLAMVWCPLWRSSTTHCLATEVPTPYSIQTTVCVYTNPSIDHWPYRKMFEFDSITLYVCHVMKLICSG